jgi:hypothetical protein
MIAPQFNLREVLAEIARDPAKRLAKIVSIMSIRGRLGCGTPAAVGALLDWLPLR